MKLARYVSMLILAVTCPAIAHEPAAAVASGADLKVLVYSDTAFYRHPDIPAINRWLVLLGHEHGFEVDITEHPKDLMPQVLAKYDLLLLNNANELDKVIPEEQRKSVEDWFAGGKKGIVGLHAALVRQTGWPWLHQLGGCDFNSDSDFLKAKVLVDPAAKEHPALGFSAHEAYAVEQKLAAQAATQERPDPHARERSRDRDREF